MKLPLIPPKGQLVTAPPLVLNEAALDAAERAYWKDDGVSRHNLAAAIRVYVEMVRDG